MTGTNGKRYKTCGSRKKKGRPGVCLRPAGWGTDHPGYGKCKLHGGKTPNGTKAAAEEMATLAAVSYGAPITVEPHQALLEELYRTAGHVAWLQLQVQELDPEDDMVGPVGAEGQSGPEGAYMNPKHEPSVWVRMYQAERKHLTEVAKACIAVGIAEWQVRLVEEQTKQMAVLLESIIGDLGLTEAQRKKLGPAIKANVQRFQQPAPQLLEAGS